MRLKRLGLKKFRLRRQLFQGCALAAAFGCSIVLVLNQILNVKVIVVAQSYCCLLLVLNSNNNNFA